MFYADDEEKETSRVGETGRTYIDFERREKWRELSIITTKRKANKAS